MTQLSTGQARTEVDGEPDKVERDPFYIQATAAPVDEVRRVLKYGETFAVFDRYGDVRSGGLGEDGLYFEGTRFLSCLILRIGMQRPLFLSSTVRDENDV